VAEPGQTTTSSVNRLTRRNDVDRRRVGLYDVDRHALEVRAVSYARLYTEGLELGRNVFFGDPSTPRGGCSAFEEIGGEEAKVRVDFLGSDAARRVVSLRLRPWS